ncbi:MAG: lipid-A-disaccharide synthase [Thermodesulfovibrionales bacterium]|jgi:lipid-A-disaccharide synthase
MASIMIISGESSGELYGALLANALKSKWPDVRIIGIGGQRMSEAGVELVSRISDAFGIIEAVASLRKLKTAFNNAVEALEKFRPDVLVLIDYPDFNLKVAKKAKALGIKVLYYVSPQVWAWRKGRVPKIASLVNRMAVLLPFEEKIYKDAGLKCDFVGHPILEEIQGVLAKGNKAEFKTALGLDPFKPLLSLLPGSRPHELKKLLPLMIEVVRQFRNDPEILKGNKEYQFCMPLAPNTDEQKYRGFIEILKKEGVAIKKGESVKVLAASDMAVVASGTATLQTAFLEVPMVVVYKMSPLEFQIGKRIINVKHISLANILAGKEVVVELLQERANPGETIKELKKIIFDIEYRENMINWFKKIKGPFIGKKASQRVADIILEMVIWRK